MKRNLDSRHHLSNDFVQALADDWKQHGIKAIEQVREKTPERYCELISKIVPKEMLIASDRSAETTAPTNSDEIAVLLLRDAGLNTPSPSAKARALDAYDLMITTLEGIAVDETTGLAH